MNNEGISMRSEVASALDIMREKTNTHSILYSAVGAIALAGASQAHASIIQGSDSVTVLDNGLVGWDIDGDSIADMILFDDTPNMCGGPNTDFYVLESAGAGAGFLYNGRDQLEVISEASTVGSAGAFAHMDCATHDNPCSSLGSTSQDFDNFPGADSGADFGGVLGFMFDNNGTTNYGIATFSFSSLDGAFPNGSFTISEWLYDDTGAAINGSAKAVDVPEPQSLSLLLMGGLAMGAAGIRSRRKKANC